jgi:hypothetical protein
MSYPAQTLWAVVVLVSAEPVGLWIGKPMDASQYHHSEQQQLHTYKSCFKTKRATNLPCQ